MRAMQIQHNTHSMIISIEWREEGKNPIPPGKNPARSRTQAFDILRLLTE